jgi:RNA-binding protein
MMPLNLNGRQRKYLRGRAHSLKPLVLIGQMGLTTSVEQALEEALNTHELVKVKFNDDKDKAFKRRALDRLERFTDACMVGAIGHVGIFYRPHPQEDKRKIVLP